MIDRKLLAERMARIRARNRARFEGKFPPDVERVKEDLRKACMGGESAPASIIRVEPKTRWGAP